KLWGVSPEHLRAVGHPEGQPAALGMIEFWATSIIDELMSCQLTVVKLFFALKQHAARSLLSRPRENGSGQARLPGARPGRSRREPRGADSDRACDPGNPRRALTVRVHFNCRPAGARHNGGDSEHVPAAED